jgi:hypothetical protein
MDIWAKGLVWGSGVPSLPRPQTHTQCSPHPRVPQPSQLPGFSFLGQVKYLSLPSSKLPATSAGGRATAPAGISPGPTEGLWAGAGWTDFAPDSSDGCRSSQIALARTHLPLPLLVFTPSDSIFPGCKIPNWGVPGEV